MFIGLQNSGYNVSTRKGIKSNCNKLFLTRSAVGSQLSFAKKTGDGMLSGSNRNGRRPSDLVKNLTLYCLSRAVHQKTTPYKRLGSNSMQNE